MLDAKGKNVAPEQTVTNTDADWDYHIDTGDDVSDTATVLSLSSNTIQTNTANCAVYFESTDSSHWIGNYLHLMSLSSCPTASADRADTLHATVLAPSCTSATEDMILALLFIVFD